MKIQFVKGCGIEVIEEVDAEGNILKSSDEHFEVGEIVEGDIFNDEVDYVNFQFGDGCCVFGLKKNYYKVVEE